MNTEWVDRVIYFTAAQKGLNVCLPPLSFAGICLDNLFDIVVWTFA